MIIKYFKENKKSIIVLILSFIILLSISFKCSRSTEYHLWNAPGPMQAIGNKKELWLFFEIDQKVYRPYGGCDYPKTISLGHIQEVVVLTKYGLKRRLRVSIDDGITFHPNITHIFYFPDNLYLFYGESANHKDSIFKWKHDHFELLPIEESDAFMSKNIAKNNRVSLDELKRIMSDKEAAEKIYKIHIEYWHPKDNKITIPYGVYINLLDLLSKKYGWKHSDNMFCCDENIKWNGIDITIQTLESQNEFEIIIKSSIFKNDTSSISLKYDRNIQIISEVDYDNLLKRDKQEAHKKH